LPDDSSLRLPSLYIPPPPVGLPLDMSLGPYRFLDPLLGDLKARIHQEAHIRHAAFFIAPFEAFPDPLFGQDEEAQKIAQESIEHRLTWQFTTPISKEALLELAQRLCERLKDREGEVTVQARVQGEVPAR
ncbi:MAG: hypothetical protein DRI61_12045, partial [Chloroflexi bacterium]